MKETKKEAIKIIVLFALSIIPLFNTLVFIPLSVYRIMSKLFSLSGRERLFYTFLLFVALLIEGTGLFFFALSVDNKLFKVVWIILSIGALCGSFIIGAVQGKYREYS